MELIFLFFFFFWFFFSFDLQNVQQNCCFLYMEQKDPKWALNEVLKVFCKTKVDVSNFFHEAAGS